MNKKGHQHDTSSLATVVAAAPVEADPIEAETVEVDEVLDPESLEQSTTTPLVPELVTDGTASDDSGKGFTEVVRYDPLESYLAEIRAYPQLSREDEHKLAVRYYETQDPQAAYQLVVANLKLVVMIAREYQRNAQNVLDLVQEGNIGLLEAVKQFDPFRGIRFPSYAVYWIRAYMLRFLINNLRLVKIGTTQAQRKLFFNLQKEKDRLEAEGFVPEAALLAKRLNVKESEVIEMEQRLLLPEISVDAPVRIGGEDAGDLHSVIPDKRVSIEDDVVEEQFAGALREAVAAYKEHADEKERAIIDRRLLTEDPVTLQEIADDFGLSRERIRQIENRLKDKLKRYLKEKLSLGDGGDVSVEDE